MHMVLHFQVMNFLFCFVIPAKAGIQYLCFWIPHQVRNDNVVFLVYDTPSRHFGTAGRFIMKKLFVLLLLIFIPSVYAADMVIGGDTIYRIVKGDSIELISAKLGVNKKNIIKDNNIDVKKNLRIKQELKANTRKIVPKAVDDGIIINIPGRMLYFFKEGKLKSAFPVGLGMPSWKGITRWRTPIEKFTIIGKRKNPTWHVPESMQWKMIMEGKPVETIVLPGPDNPLGRYAIDTSIPRVVIHETNCVSIQKPWMYQGYA